MDGASMDGDAPCTRPCRGAWGDTCTGGTLVEEHIIGVPGDTIRIQGTELWINGEHTDRLWLAKSLPGKTVGDYDTEMVLPPGQYFVMGTTHESFDSRYWGPLHREAIIGTARPLL